MLARATAYSLISRFLKTATMLLILLAGLSGQSVSTADGKKREPATMEVIQRLPHKNYVQGLAWNSDGSKLATLSDFGALVTIWDAKTWEKELEIRQYSAGYAGPGIGWTLNGNLLTSAGAETQDEGIYSMNLWNPVTGVLVKKIEGPPIRPGDVKHNQAFTIGVSKSGFLAAIILGHIQSKVMIFNTADWSIQRIIELEGVPPLKAGFATAIAFAPDDRSIAIANGGNLLMVDLTDGRTIWSVRAYKQIENISGAIVYSLTFSPDGKFLVSAPNFFPAPSDRNPVRIWDSIEGKLVLALPGDEITTRSIDWSADGARLAFVSDLKLQAWDVRNPRKAKFLSKYDKVAGLAVSFSPKGFLAVADNFSVLIFK
jgi:WD40 repeat protein